MKKLLYIIQFIGFFSIIGLNSSVSHASIFGSKNYEACVLDQMKGQDASLLSTARSYCYRKFPDETQFPHGLIKLEWCENKGLIQTICIKDIPKDVEVTKIEAVFTTVECDLWIASTPSDKFEGKKSRFSNKISLKTSSRSYKCSRLYAFGYDRR